MKVIEARVLDATHLELARPIQTSSGEKLLVCVTEPGDADDERRNWLAASASSLAAGYGKAEPEYSLDMIKEPNAEYEG